MVKPMNELKPCPFCGGEANIFTKSSVERGVTKGWEFGIYCTKCNVTTPKTNYRLEVQIGKGGNLIYNADERTQAAEAWNRRVGDTNE